MSKLDINGSIINHLGKTSYFFEVQTIDLDHLYDSEKSVFWRNLNRTLNQINNDEYFIKVHKIQNKIFIQTESNDFKLEGWNLIKCENIFRKLLGKNDIYSEPIFEKDCLIIDGEYFRFISFYDFPYTMTFSRMNEFENIFMNFKKIPTEVSKARASRASKKHQSNIDAKSTIQIESEKAVSETLGIYSSLIEGTTSLFNTQIWTYAKASNRESLNIKTKEVIEKMERMDATPLIETIANKTIFKSFLPTNYISFTRSHDIPTDYLSCLMPYNGNSIHQQGVTFHSHSDEEVKIDIFNQNLSNYNAIISGKSGSGKSMCGQKIVFDLINSKKTKGVILDKGHSFEKITHFTGGNLFSEKFNPLQFLNPLYLKEFIVSVISEEELNKKKKGEISEAVEKFLSSKKPKTFSNLLAKMQETVPDIHLYFSEIAPFICDDIIEIKDLTYVDTSLFPKSVISPLIIYLIEYFKNIDGRKIFVFDECWEFMKNNTEYIEESYRTFRKFDGSAIAITQSISDFLSQNNAIGEIIFNNTCHKFYFKQDRIPDGLINEEDAEIVMSLETKQGTYSEFLYKDEFLRKPCRFWPSELEYELFTSKKSENDLIKKFLNQKIESIGYKNSFIKWVNTKYEIEIR